MVISNSFFKFYFIFYFTILYCFCHTSTCIHHGCTHVPHPELPSHLPPHTIPLGRPSAPALSFLYPASNLDWRFVSYMILYMFQCHSPKTSHPHTLPQSPKDCSIHLCLFCCLSFIFLFPFMPAKVRSKSWLYTGSGVGTFEDEGWGFPRDSGTTSYHSWQSKEIEDQGYEDLK